MCSGILRQLSVAAAIVGALALGRLATGQTTFYWVNWSGDGAWTTPLNWNRFPDPPYLPGPADTAVFQYRLGDPGALLSAVKVPNGTEINSLRVIDAAIVDMTIGDGTATSGFSFEGGDSMIVGDSPGDTAMFSLLGGRLATSATSVGGRAVVNVTGPGAVWNPLDLQISGDTTVNTAGVGLGQGAEILSEGRVDVGSDTGSGRVVVDGRVPSPYLDKSALWWIKLGENLDIGPDSPTGLNFGQVTLQNGGRMHVGWNASVHGSADVPGLSKLTVQSGGQLDVQRDLNIGRYGVLELLDGSSKITAGSLSKSDATGAFTWTAGALELTAEHVVIDAAVPHPVLGGSLIIGASKRLIVSTDVNYLPCLIVGRDGPGDLSIEGGGYVESFAALIGEGRTSQGVATVAGPGSTWTVSQHLCIGAAAGAQGQLNIQNGGAVKSRDLWCSTMGGALIVDGVDSLWNNAGNASFGNDTGGSDTLTIRNGGNATIGGNLTVNRFGAVNLAGGGSQLNVGQITLQPGATFGTGGGTTLRANSLKGFGDHLVINGNLQLGHAAGNLFPDIPDWPPVWHRVLGNQSLTVGQNLVVGVDVPAVLQLGADVSVTSGRSFIAAEEGAQGSAVFVERDSVWSVHDSLYVGGDATGAGGSASITAGGRLEIARSLKIWSTGAVYLNEGYIIANDIHLTAGGELQGHGAIDLEDDLTNDGIVRPGDLKLVRVNCNYVQGPTGALHAILDGTDLEDHSRLTVYGRAILDGALQAVLAPTYTPQAGDAFEFLHAYGGLSGRFATESLPPIPGKPGLQFQVDYDAAAGTVSLAVEPIFAADFDEDGDVDGQDLAAWSAGCGLAGVALHAQGDADGDQDVDGDDFLVWQRQLGSKVAAQAAIPEPATCLLCGLAAAVCLGRRRKVRSACR